MSEKKLEKGETITWEITGLGKHYEMTGKVLCFIPRGTEGWTKLPLGAYSKRPGLTGPGCLATSRVHGVGMNNLNDRYLVEATVDGLKHYYFPTTATLKRLGVV